MLTKDQLKELIKEVGAEIQPKLDPLPYRKERNAYAHIHGAINQLLGSSYNEADAGQVEALVNYIRDNPNASHQYLALCMMTYIDQLIDNYNADEANPLIKD